MSTNSSSDEENEFLKEAVDPTLFSNDLYQSRSRQAIPEKTVKLPPSLRYNDKPSTFNPFEIRVTPEFRSYVSKHLKRVLDGIIDYTEEVPTKRKKKSKKTTHTGGVKLLRTSHDFVTENQEHQEPIPCTKKNPKKHKRKVEDYGSSDEEKRVREVAVSAEWIISGKATMGWAPCTKGEVEFITAQPPKK